MENLLREYSEFEQDLQVPFFISQKVKNFLQELNAVFLLNSNEISQKVLFACCIYIVIQDEQSSTEVKIENNVLPSLTVSQLLEKAGMSITDFFSVTCLLKNSHHLSNSSKQKLIALERKYLIVSALYDKFESMIGDIFSAECTSTSQNVATSTSYELSDLLKHHKALCWMLFIVAKAKVLWHRQELIATFHLLLCCIAEVIKATPTFLLLPPFDGIAAKNDDSVAVLKVLTNHVKTKFEEVIAVHDGWLHVANELIVDSKLPELENLQNIYNQLYLQSGDIDESQFLCHDWHLLPQNLEQSSSPRKSFTLVRRTLDTADALNRILLSASDELSPSLKNYLLKCNVDGITIIQDFIADSEKSFVEAFVNAQEGGSKSLAEKRFKLASRYYYIMLEAFLKKESERVTPAEITCLIQNKVLQKSLLSCCLEVTLMSYGNVGSINFTPVVHGGNTHAQGITFPWILTVYDLEPFQFFKIIESFIRAAPAITQQIIRHLKDIEDKILESLAWQSRSSVFRGLSGQGCSPTCKAKVDSPKPLSKFWSPDKDSSQSSPSSPSLCHAVNLFLNKVSRLAFQRLEKLCTSLQITKDIQGNIWTCIEHVIYKKNHLLKDRHLDQIIMCCIFAICKILEKEVRFKSIVSCYNHLPNTSVSVYKYVLSGGRKDYIIVFYNKEFNIEMKDYILSTFGNKNKVDSSASLNSVQSPYKLSPSFSLPGRKNIFISPLKQSPFKNPNEVMNQLFPSYSVGSLTQSPKTLQIINDTLNVLNPTYKKPEEIRGKKRLQFGNGADGESRESSVKKVLKFDQAESSSENSKSEKVKEGDGV